MAITSGFFNSVSGDRTYNADQMSSMFEGLVSDGVYESVGDAFVVTAYEGLTVNVGTGRAMLNGGKWVKNTAPEAVTLNAPHVLLSRYTAIVLRLDIAERSIGIEMIDGDASSTPAKPAIVRNNAYWDLLLAYVYVGAGASSITQANIEDTRANTDVCGWVTGIITQVDTSTLFLQWQAMYEEFYNTFTTAFEEWFESLTEQLQVNTYIESYSMNASVTSAASQDITFTATGYTYADGDIFIVSFNGLRAVPSVDYTVNTTGSAPVFHVNMTGTTENPQDVEILVLKSKIGSSQM